MDGIHRSVCAVVAAVAMLKPAVTHAQTGRGIGTTIPDPGTTVNGTGGRINPNSTPDDFGPESASMRVLRENARKLQHKERLVSSATRLLELTKQFQVNVATHAELTPDDMKRLDDIAKLAREVRSRMVEE